MQFLGEIAKRISAESQLTLYFGINVMAASSYSFNLGYDNHFPEYISETSNGGGMLHLSSLRGGCFHHQSTSQSFDCPKCLNLNWANLRWNDLGWASGAPKRMRARYLSQFWARVARVEHFCRSQSRRSHSYRLSCPRDMRAEGGGSSFDL